MFSVSEPVTPPTVLPLESRQLVDAECLGSAQEWIFVWGNYHSQDHNVTWSYSPLFKGPSKCSCWRNYNSPRTVTITRDIRLIPDLLTESLKFSMRVAGTEAIALALLYS